MLLVSPDRIAVTRGTLGKDTMIVLLSGMALVAAAQTQPAAPAILQQAALYQIIALGERHGVPAMEEFIEALVSDDEFGEQFDVLILENASAAHQNLIDRYVSGDDIPEDALAPVWRDAVNSLLAGGDNTHYARLLAAVRENNRDDVSPVRVIACDRLGEHGQRARVLGSNEQPERFLRRPDPEPRS